MADQEAFEDELFADLYADEEPAKAPAPEPAHETPSALPPAAEYASTTVDNAQADNQNYNGEDSYMNQDDYEDEDDEVAFNLGNDSTAQYEDTPSYSAPPAAAVSAPPAKGPNAKEDG